MEIIKICDTCQDCDKGFYEKPCVNCNGDFDKWTPKVTAYNTINPTELITELNTKLYSEAELTHMSNRDAITGEAVNKVVGELIDWVKNK